MKLLLDECVPERLKNYFPGHEVTTIEQANFKGLKNGNLLRAAGGLFDVLITVDKNYGTSAKQKCFAVGDTCFVGSQQPF